MLFIENQSCNDLIFFRVSNLDVNFIIPILYKCMRIFYTKTMACENFIQLGRDKLRIAFILFINLS